MRERGGVREERVWEVKLGEDSVRRRRHAGMLGVAHEGELTKARVPRWLQGVQGGGRVRARVAQMASQPDIPSFVLPDNYTSPTWPSLGTSTQLYLLTGAWRACWRTPPTRRALKKSPLGGHGWTAPADVWLFVTLWTLVMATAIYVMAGVWILVVFGKTKLAWIVVPTFILFGAVTSFLAGAIIGTGERGRARARERAVSGRARARSSGCGP